MIATDETSEQSNKKIEIIPPRELLPFLPKQETTPRFIGAHTRSLSLESSPDSNVKPL